MEKKKILIVDDQGLILRMLEQALTLWGYEPCLAPDGEDALRVFAENPGTLLLLSDLQLPGMSGIDLMRILKVQSPELKGILMTENIDEGIIRLAHEAGFKWVIPKPLDLESLKSMIRDLIGEGATERGEQ